MIRYRCRKCNCVLYEYEGIGDYTGTLTPLEVALMLNFTCPNCKSKLNPFVENPDWREHIRIAQSKTTRKTQYRVKKKTKQRNVSSNEITGVEWISNTEFIVVDY
jgi:hypothetical protein